jgi:hypothetical protein
VQNLHHQTRSILAIFSWYGRLFLLLSAFLLCLFSKALADSGEKEGRTAEQKWFLTLYAGASAQRKIGDVVRFKATFPDDSGIVVVALARELWRYGAWVSLETEGQVGKHFGAMDHWEFNGLLCLRWHPFWWDKHLETSFAVGNGLSYATEIPDVEIKHDDKTQRFLDYLLLELALGLPEYPRWDLVIRVHHRSGVAGLFGGVDGGANFVCGGIKYSF